MLLVVVLFDWQRWRGGSATPVSVSLRTALVGLAVGWAVLVAVHGEMSIANVFHDAQVPLVAAWFVVIDWRRFRGQSAEAV